MFEGVFENYVRQWQSYWGSRVPPLAAKFAKNWGKNQEKQGKIRKTRKNWEEKAKIEKALSLCPSWQIGLATLLMFTYVYTTILSAPHPPGFDRSLDTLKWDNTLNLQNVTVWIIIYFVFNFHYIILVKTIGSNSITYKCVGS